MIPQYAVRSLRPFQLPALRLCYPSAFPSPQPPMLSLREFQLQ